MFDVDNLTALHSHHVHPMSLSTTTFALILSFVLCVRFRKQKRALGPLPPGPRPVFILGNVRDLTLDPAKRWAEQYGQQRSVTFPVILMTQRCAGDVTYLHVLGQGLLFLSGDALVDLQDKRGSIHSDGAKLTIAGEL